ncbi:MAG: nucleotidyltransferase domain-containing protein [Nanoarchaeota archaeon]
MQSQKEIVGILEKELPYLRSNYNVKRLGLFGSIAKYKQKKGSDVDIIIEFKTPIGLEFIELVDYIERLVGRKVDILTNEGIKGIRIKKVAEDIKRSVLYVKERRYRTN